MGGAVSASYAYDTESSSAQAAHNRRVKQTINGETIYTVYGLNGSILHRDNITTGETTEYLRLGMGGRTVARIVNDGTSVETIYSHADHLGSSASATDASGNLLWREDYTPFGETRQNPLANANEESFTGHIRDTATGLTYMQARYYDPVIGRFLSNDPVGFAEGGAGFFNRYAYTYNDPVNHTDPNGEFGIFGAVAGGVVELGFQLASSEGRAAYAQAGRALANGDVGGAWNAAGANVTKVAISSAAGAVGQVGATRVAQGASALAQRASNVRTAEAIVVGGNMLGNAAVGAGTGAGAAQAQNSLAGADNNVGLAALGGGVGGALGSTVSVAIRGNSQVLADATGNLISAPNGTTAAPLASHGRTASLAEGAASGVAEAIGNNAVDNEHNREPMR